MPQHLRHHTLGLGTRITRSLTKSLVPISTVRTCNNSSRVSFAPITRTKVGLNFFSGVPCYIAKSRSAINTSKHYATSGCFTANQMAWKLFCTRNCIAEKVVDGKHVRRSSSVISSRNNSTVILCGWVASLTIRKIGIGKIFVILTRPVLDGNRMKHGRVGAVGRDQARFELEVAGVLEQIS